VAAAERNSVADQWARARQRLEPLSGGEPFGLRFQMTRRGLDRPRGMIEFAAAAESGRLVHGRCPRERALLDAEGAGIDPAGDCTLSFDLRPGLVVTLQMRGDRLAEWRRGQAAAEAMLTGFLIAAAEARGI
jgi:hypothetical protein